MHKQESRHKVPKSVLRAVLGRMQFILHATRRTPLGASRLAHAMSDWLRKIRRAPSPHGRDAMVYGHTTTATHKLSTPPPPQMTAAKTILGRSSTTSNTVFRAAKKTLRCSSTTSNTAVLRAELGMYPLETNRDVRNLKWQYA